MIDFFLPTIAYAAGDLTIKGLMFRISYYILNPMIILGFVVALIYFTWGLLRFLKNRQSNAEASNVGKSHMGARWIIYHGIRIRYYEHDC